MAKTKEKDEVVATVKTKPKKVSAKTEKEQPAEVATERETGEAIAKEAKTAKAIKAKQSKTGKKQDIEAPAQEKMSDVDVARDILEKKGEPIHYKELITEVIDRQNKPVQSMPALISQIYTMINMDSRFHYEGNGKWGLTLWVPPEVKRGHAKTLAKLMAERDAQEEKFMGDGE